MTLGWTSLRFGKKTGLGGRITYKRVVGFRQYILNEVRVRKKTKGKGSFRCQEENSLNHF